MDWVGSLLVLGALASQFFWVLAYARFLAMVLEFASDPRLRFDSPYPYREPPSPLLCPADLAPWMQHGEVCNAKLREMLQIGKKSLDNTQNPDIVPNWTA